ncbi:U3 small nucleolar RNA-associated protein 25 isoform X2 [Quercus lobata]|uniref:U3 small nucleolar RNA-associated protein 25 isoform X2 n=1 Tax=Quercus lobata TaxID=97700 RepID=UPI00124717D6|nr:U3 small nucleolar RNA-associated protein 25 isoform X2 [Quercus lobata]
MGKQFAKNRGLKRSKAPSNSESNHVIKNRRVEQKLARTRTRSPSPSPSGEASEEQSSGAASEEEVIHREASMYDKLLMSLRSCSKSVDTAYKKRQRQEEGKSDSEVDEEDGFESFSVSVEDDKEDESTIQQPDMVDPGEQSEDAETEDDHEASDTDQEHDIRANGQTSTDGSECMSSFNLHLEHKLSKEEVDNMSTKKWKYKWEVPVVGMSNCKWMGTEECFLKDVNTNSDYGLKLKLYKHWLDVYKTSGGDDFHSSKERLFFSLCNSYRDILHCDKKPFYLKGREEDSSIMDAYIIHSLNHVLKTRDLVTKNDTKLAKHPESADNEMLNGDSFLDHGFTRPKVLILLPLRRIALRVVQRLIQLTPSAYKVNVDHIDRFLKEFGTQEVEDDEDELSQQTQGNSKAKKSSKPSDFLELFGGKRDEEDHFMFGIKFTRKSIKLYSDFYSSDVIVASPVRLIAKISEAKTFKEKDVDYLSSIEVLIIDHADVIAMQNWSHVNTVVEQLNHIPSKQHGTDVMRIRPWCLDGYAKFYRQSIILGYYSNPDINALFNRHCSNYQGKVKLVCEYKGILPKVILQVRQIYERFDVDSIADADDARFDYFVKVFPKIKDSVQGGTMLFISSYFEFVRIRNFLKSQEASFCLLGEYTQPSDISRARLWFFEGRRKIMLYTERAHFYYRYKIRGIQNLIIYSLPERKEFYPEIVNMLDGSHNMSCTVLFSRFDQFRLERIVGTAPSKRMVTSEKGVFVFC